MDTELIFQIPSDSLSDIDFRAAVKFSQEEISRIFAIPASAIGPIDRGRMELLDLELLDLGGPGWPK